MNQESGIENRELQPIKIYARTAKDLEVFKKAYALSLEIHQAAERFPKHELYSLADQLKRATRSICANLAEGFAKQKDSKPEFARFISMCIGSCAEVDIWLSYTADLGYADVADCSRWQAGYDVVLKMLRNLKSSLA